MYHKVNLNSDNQIYISPLQERLVKENSPPIPGVAMTKVRVVSTQLLNVTQFLKVSLKICGFAENLPKRD